MILIDPPRSAAENRRNPLKKSELADFMQQALEAVEIAGSVSVLLTGDAIVRELNRQYRHKDAATDVLSFPAAMHAQPANRRSRPIAGDLAISLDAAARQAAEFGHPLAVEVRILLLHGLLHLAGFDHERDSGQMARLERKLRKRFKLPSALIERAGGKTARPKDRKS